MHDLTVLECLRPGLDANFFGKMGTVAFSLLFGKYCPIMV
jgi:hypothetical protein